MRDDGRARDLVPHDGLCASRGQGDHGGGKVGSRSEACEVLAEGEPELPRGGHDHELLEDEEFYAYSLGYVQYKLSHLDQKNYFLDKSRSKQLQEYPRYNHLIRVSFVLDKISFLFPSFLRNKILLKNEKADCPHS